MSSLKTRPPNIVFLENGMLNIHALEGGLELETVKFWIRRRLLEGIEDFLPEPDGVDDRNRAVSFRVLWDMSPCGSRFREYVINGVRALLPDFWASNHRCQTRAYINLVCKIDDETLYRLVEDLVECNDRGLDRRRLLVLGWHRFERPPVAPTGPTAARSP